MGICRQDIEKRIISLGVVNSLIWVEIMIIKISPIQVLPDFPCNVFRSLLSIILIQLLRCFKVTFGTFVLLELVHFADYLPDGGSNVNLLKLLRLLSHRTLNIEPHKMAREAVNNGPAQFLEIKSLVSHLLKAHGGLVLFLEDVVFVDAVNQFFLTINKL